MSIFDDNGADLGEFPPVPATEARGGRAVDWDSVRPGEPLPEKGEDASES
jgi:hypothetical protein